jgi:transglutaminase-like putative cysteine protease
MISSLKMKAMLIITSALLSISSQSYCLCLKENLTHASSRQIANTSKSIVKDCKSNDDKIQAIFNYVHDNIKYDYDLMNKIYTGYIVGGQDDLNTLKKKKGVCKGIAALLTSLLQSQGFKAVYYQGYVTQEKEKLGHAWTQIDSTIYDATTGYQGVFTNYFKTN